jgi:hypothetical protein
MPDFDTPPPSRRIGREDEAGLTEAERRELDRQRLWGETPREPPPPIWEPAAVSGPAALALLSFAHSVSGQPLPPAPPPEPVPPGPHASDQELTAYEGRRHRAFWGFREEDASFMRRFVWWASLDVASRLQLALDTHAREVWNDPPGTPLWSVQVLTDRSQPPGVVQAPTAEAARERFRSTAGIRFVDPAPGVNNGDPWSVTPYQPPEVPNGTAGDR